MAVPSLPASSSKSHTLTGHSRHRHKKAVRRGFTERRTGHQSAAASATAPQLGLQAIEGQVGAAAASVLGRPIGLQDPLMEAGLDSLGEVTCL